MMGEILRDTRCFGAAGRLVPARVFDDDQRLRLFRFIAREMREECSVEGVRLSRSKRRRTDWTSDPDRPAANLPQPTGLIDGVAIDE